MRIDITIIGADVVANKLRVLGDQMPAAAGRALRRFVELEIATPAKEHYVPVITNTLRSSIVVLEPTVSNRSVVVVIGAGGAAAPYARKVHENPRSGRTGGYAPYGGQHTGGAANVSQNMLRPRRYKKYSRVGQWKYLETPAMEAANTRLYAFARECGVELDEVISGLR